MCGPGKDAEPLALQPAPRGISACPGTSKGTRGEPGSSDAGLIPVTRLEEDCGLTASVDGRPTLDFSGAPRTPMRRGWLVIGWLVV